MFSLDFYNVQAFDYLLTNPIDPFDILNDIQFFQDSDFTAKMTNSSSYRNLYTHLFNSMNNNKNNNVHDNQSNYYSSPIYLNNDHLFRSTPKSRTNRHQQRHHFSSKPNSNDYIPVIHSTMANDWFLNELIDLHDDQNFVNIQAPYSLFNNVDYGNLENLDEFQEKENLDDDHDHPHSICSSSSHLIFVCVNFI